MECFRSNGKDQQCCGLPSQGSRRSDISTNDFISAVCTDLSVKAIFAYFLTVLEPASRAALDTPKLGGQYAVRLPAAQAGWFLSRRVLRGSLRNHPALRACPPNLGGQIACFQAFHGLADRAHGRLSLAQHSFRFVGQSSAAGQAGRSLALLQC